MADLIDKQKALKKLSWDTEAYQTINMMPAIEAEPVKRGRWIHLDDGTLSYRCSVCGKHAYGCYAEIFQGEYHYCPNCGAKMRGEDA